MLGYRYADSAFFVLDTATKRNTADDRTTVLGEGQVMDLCAWAAKVRGFGRSIQSSSRKVPG